MNKVTENYEKIKAQIVPYNPKIVAVTKYFDESQIIKYYNIGFRDFGENRVKDALEKMNKLPGNIIETSRFHLIGHLQTNKAKLAVGKFYLIHSVDSVKLAEIISEEAIKKGIVQNILLQVNNAGEEQKSGFSPEEIFDEFPDIMKLKGINVMGLMNMAPLDCSEDKLHELFGNIKQIYDALQLKYKVKLSEISMGMSNDFRIALEEGASIIRLGRILFK